MPILPLQTPFIPANIVLAQSIQTDLEQFKQHYGDRILEENEITLAQQSLQAIHEKALQLFKNEYASLRDSLMLSHLLRLDIFFNDYATQEFLHSFIEALQYDLDDFDQWHIHTTTDASPATLKGYWTTLIKFVDILPKYGLLNLEETDQIKKHIRTNKKDWIKRMEKLSPQDEEIKTFFLRAKGYA